MPGGKMRHRRNRRPKKLRRRFHKRKQRYNKAATTLTLRNPTGFPDRIKLKMKYVEHITMQSLVSSAVLYQFRGNALFDPNLTGTGHQPYTFDQWSAIYQRYRVYGSSIQVDAINSSGTIATIMYVAPAEDETTTSVANIDYLAELPRAGYSKMIPIAQRMPSRIKRYVSTRAICGITKPEMEADDTYAALVTANPSRIWVWDIVVTSADGTTILSPVYLEVKIVYYAEFFAPYLLSQS